MTDRRRFCVKFSGTDAHSLEKTRVLYKDSTTQDIREIWRVVNNSEPPEDIQMTIENHTSYSLSDENDFSVVMAIAEDQYRAHPTEPLRIKLSLARGYKPATPPSSNPSPEQRSAEQTDSLKNAQENNPVKKSPAKSSDNNLIESKTQNTNPDSTADGDESKKIIESQAEDLRVQDLSVKKKVPNSFRDVKTFYNQHMFSTGESLLVSNKRKILPGYTEAHQDDSPEVKRSYVATPSSHVPTANYKFDSVHPCFMQSTLNVNAAQAFIATLQQHRLLQSSPSTPHIIQSMQNSYAAAQLMRHFKPAINGQKTDLKYLYNGDSNFAPSNPHLVQNIKKPKRKSNITLEGEKKGVKRMRSSSSLSNIEFHLQQAQLYMNLSETEKKEHNSAHRSHWKHLIHVHSICPQFVSMHKEKKYDEWSSEARDIYAITLPEEYKWSFLTLAKQGDQLCKRIKERVIEMTNLPAEQRPEWCPSDKILQITFAKADERLQQLQRIRDARHSNLTTSLPSSELAHSSNNQLFTSPPQKQKIINPDSSLRRDVFRETSWNLFQQPGNINPSLLAYNASFQPSTSSDRPTMPSENFIPFLANAIASPSEKPKLSSLDHKFSDEQESSAAYTFQKLVTHKKEILSLPTTTTTANNKDVLGETQNNVPTNSKPSNEPGSDSPLKSPKHIY